jgi:hypothetical protein
MPCVHFFAGAAELVAGRGVNSYGKFLLDGTLVVLIVVLVWMGVGVSRNRRNNNNGDRPD